MDSVLLRIKIMSHIVPFLKVLHPKPSPNALPRQRGQHHHPARFKKL